MRDQASACRAAPTPDIACAVTPGPMGRAGMRGRRVIRLAAIWKAVWRRVRPQAGERALRHLSEAELRDIGASSELRSHIGAAQEFERHRSGSPYYF
jgi:uncharacterized protein YjiS (DUF1127 family)